MAISVAIIGDDLTGTLDAAAPFAGRGLATFVALTADDTGLALQSGADVVAVNTVSRALAPDEAGRRVGDVARLLSAAGPTIAFKKLDSRLKGNPGAETEAALAGFGRARGIVSPAIPELGRFVANGALAGFGVDPPIVIADRFAGLADQLTIPDAADSIDLDLIASDILADAASTLAIGARGLGHAIALRLVATAAMAPAFLPLPRPIAVGIASRDPITAAQIALLQAELPEWACRTAPNGVIDDFNFSHEISLIAATADSLNEDAQVVAERFALGLSRLVTRGCIGTLVLSGGDTAFAVLRALGVRILKVEGEVLPGVPYSTATIAGRSVVIVTKSGGFGEADLLLRLAAPADGGSSGRIGTDSILDRQRAGGLGG